MITLSVKIQNLDKLKSNFNKAPFKTVDYLKKAVAASVAEIQKQAIDRNFQFKTPRGLRSGYLQQSFAFGTSIAPNGLSASVGPTALYAPFVYFGTSRGISPNPYMDRIAQAAEGDVNKHFNDAVDAVVSDLAS